MRGNCAEGISPGSFRISKKEGKIREAQRPRNPASRKLSRYSMRAQEIKTKVKKKRKEKRERERERQQKWKKRKTRPRSKSSSATFRLVQIKIVANVFAGRDHDGSRRVTRLTKGGREREKRIWKKWHIHIYKRCPKKTSGLLCRASIAWS